MDPQRARRALVRVDADASIGRGHAVRTAALIDALAWTEPPIVSGEGPDLGSLFPGARIEPAARFAELAEEARVVIIDHPNPHVADLEMPALKVVIDDCGEIGSADIIVAGSGPASRHVYPKLGEQVLRLCGPRYALLRAAFTKPRQATAGTAAPRLLLLAGSGTHASEWLLGLLADIEGELDRVALDVVVGASFADPGLLQEICNANGHWLGCNLAADALAERLSSASVAVVTGGMIVPETLALGVPCVAFPNEPELVEEIAWLDGENALCGLDPCGNPAEAWNHVRELLSDEERAVALATSGRRLFDGQGTARVAAAIEERLAGVPH
ncbi:MAG: hypothetical protein GY723_04720 [bacterium]|nr:hypothetical protein [bacterium]MCP5067747.1 hypothetical protein [bacterium]